MFIIELRRRFFKQVMGAVAEVIFYFYSNDICLTSTYMHIMWKWLPQSNINFSCIVITCRNL